MSTPRINFEMTAFSTFLQHTKRRSGEKSVCCFFSALAEARTRHHQVDLEGHPQGQGHEHRLRRLDQRRKSPVPVSLWLCLCVTNVVTQKSWILSFPLKKQLLKFVQCHH